MRLWIGIDGTSRLAFAVAALLTLATHAMPQTEEGISGYQIRTPTDANLKSVESAIFDCRSDHQSGCVFPALVREIEAAYRFPRPVKVTVEQCSPATEGMGAFYSRAEHGIHVCYQLGLVLVNGYIAEGKTLGL